MKKILFICLCLLCISCGKAFLDTKPDKSLLIPETPADLQALLDNSAVFNGVPGITGIADGDFYTTPAGWTAWATDGERNSYTWAADIYGTGTGYDWNRLCQQVFYANVVLDAGYGGDPGIRGMALFSRAFAHYHLLQLFAPPYAPATAATDLGIPLRLVSDVSQRSARASVADSYARVLADLRAAAPLLPLNNNEKSRPVAAAAYAMLARTYLVMGDYARAGLYADTCLQSRNTLIDYNTLSATASKPFPRAVPYGNDEVIYYAAAGSYSFASSASTLADTTLYRSYAANDLRKSIFFKASGLSGTFKGNYAGIVAIFGGLATDELYLVRAECAARQGQTAAAMADLNTLLVKRWKTGTFVPLAAPDAATALSLILTERRKELVGRNLRWTDLRRLNNVALARTLNGTTYTLAPGSPRYTYPLPADEISLGGLQQNAR